MTSGRPRLRGDLRVIEQRYRGEQIFVLRDPATQRHFRFRPAEITVMRSFDGARTEAEIAAALADEGLRVSATAVEGFAAKLKKLGLLERSLSERTTLELERVRAERQRRRSLFRGEIFRMRWSFGDPDQTFNKVLPYIRWCFSPAFVAASVVLFAAYFVILAVTWDEFTRAVAGLYSLHALTLGTFAILWLTGVAIFGVHELGHGFTCKYFGGEVHEMGFMMLYLEPAVYCNVNDAWGFPELRARLWVTAAGSWIQFAFASVAALVWWITIPGTLASDVAVAAMLLGGVATLVSNMNPLIPLDGYFALSDYLEIPNLRLRALAYLGWWFKRYVLRLELPEPPATEHERRVFLIYGALAFVYIGTLFAFVAGIVFGWARQLFGAVGGLLVAGAIVYAMRGRLRDWRRTAMLVVRTRGPTWKEALTRRPFVALWSLIALVAILALVPQPIVATGAFTSAPVLTRWPTAPDSGVVAQVLVSEGARVAPGAPLVRLLDLQLARNEASAARLVDSLAASETRARALGLAGAAERFAMERAAATAALTALEGRLDRLTVRARASGVVFTHRPEELLGRRLGPGDTLLTMGDPDSVEVRVALVGGGASLVRAGQPVRLLSYADVGAPREAIVASVSTMGRGNVEARVRLPSAGAWRAGVTGEASVEIGRSNVLGALWWAVRKRIRTDLLM